MLIERCRNGPKQNFIYTGAKVQRNGTGQPRPKLVFYLNLDRDYCLQNYVETRNTLKVALKRDGAKTDTPSITNTVISCIQEHFDFENVHLNNRRSGGFGSSTNKTFKPL